MTKLRTLYALTFLLGACNPIEAISPCDYTAVAKAALRQEARFVNVTVTSGYMGFPRIVVLGGSVKTERDKWDARSAIWNYHAERPSCRPEGIMMTNIWSEEWRDYQVSHPIKILPCTETHFRPPCSMPGYATDTIINQETKK